MRPTRSSKSLPGKSGSVSRNTDCARRSSGFTTRELARAFSPSRAMPPASLSPPPSSMKWIDSFARSTNAAIFGKAANSACANPILSPDTISGRLIALQARIVEVVKRTEDEFLKAELQELGRRINEARAGSRLFSNRAPTEHVYWVERTGKAAQFLTLNAAPIDIAPVLRADAFSGKLLRA